ncbi:MAG: hypothetical protein SynsKO_33540 [Synoicihabitans sp.]
MTRNLLPALLSLCLIPALVGAAITRNVEKSFPASTGDEIVIDISGGNIEVEIVPGSDQAEITLHQRFKTNDESEIAEVLEQFEITFEKRGDNIVLAVKPERSGGFFSRWISSSDVKFSATLNCPADVDLSLDTSGGRISVAGFVEGNLHADTSGGSIVVTGGSGTFNLDTSGGSITVDEIHGSVRADTSGGSIAIDYVGPEARKVNADTSGGSIRIGLDATGRYDLVADTSGGRVSVSDLEIAAAKISRTHVRGEINGGGASVRADTSGGSIYITATTP